MYLDSLRALEKRVERTSQWTHQPLPSVDTKGLNLEVSHKDPEEYTRCMYDLLYLAFLTDSTRYATLMLESEHSSGSEMWNYAKAPKDLVEKVQNLRRVSDKYNFPLPAAALQFPLFNPLVSAVIPGARTREEFSQILGWFSTKIPPDFWDELKAEGLIDPLAPTS